MKLQLVTVPLVLKNGKYSHLKSLLATYPRLPLATAQNGRLCTFLHLLKELQMTSCPPHQLSLKDSSRQSIAVISGVYDYHRGEERSTTLSPQQSPSPSHSQPQTRSHIRGVQSWISLASHTNPDLELRDHPTPTLELQSNSSPSPHHNHPNPESPK